MLSRAGRVARAAALLALASALLVVLFPVPCSVVRADTPVASEGLVAATDAAAETTEAPVADQGPLVDTFMAGRQEGQGLAVVTSVSGSAAAERYYGSSDAAGTSAVTADTRFEWGRCADLVVWACVMQLVEAGELSLSDVVADDLPSSVGLPQGYEGLTVLDLMNHTTGLDVAMVGSRSSLPDGVTSVASAFSLFSVEAAFDPGEIVAYSPYDALLAAAVVESVAQQDFVSYAQEHVLDRLGMDATHLMVGGSAARAERATGLSQGGAVLAEGQAASSGTATTQSSSGSVFTCWGPVRDLLALANGLMCVGDDKGAWVFDAAATADELFQTTRTYPGLGIPRIAHGLFAFPFSDGVLGISASVATGYSASVYMDRSTGLAMAIMVNQAGRADLVQGIPRVLVGRTDGAVALASTVAAGDWTGTYQDASSPNHGPAKLLTALQRVHVSVGAQGNLLFNGLSTTSLGAGVYSVDTATDQDVYRFHVNLEQGSEFSRVASDSYAVPAATLAVEEVLLAGLGASWLACVAYLAVGVRAGVVARLRRRRARLRPVLLVLAGATCAAGLLGVAAALQLAEGMAPAALGTVLAAQAVYVGCAAVCLVWAVVAFWRRGSAWTCRQTLACALVCLAAVTTVLNLVYWEMLP